MMSLLQFLLGACIALAAIGWAMIFLDWLIDRLIDLCSLPFRPFRHWIDRRRLERQRRQVDEIIRKMIKDRAPR